jgi:hypothetical protein
MWCSANKLSSISLQVTLRNVGFGCKICLRTGCDNCASLERGTCTRERETGRRAMVTCIVLDSEGLGSVIMVLIKGRVVGVIYREEEAGAGDTHPR